MELAGDMYGFGMLGNTIYHYIAYALVAGTAIFLLVRFQSRTLYRTRKLLQEKEKAYKEIDRQRYELERKNKDVTDSLIYASYIQKALLPSDEYFIALSIKLIKT